MARAAVAEDVVAHIVVVAVEMAIGRPRCGTAVDVYTVVVDLMPVAVVVVNAIAIATPGDGDEVVDDAPLRGGSGIVVIEIHPPAREDIYLVTEYFQLVVAVADVHAVLVAVVTAEADGIVIELRGFLPLNVEAHVVGIADREAVKDSATLAVGRSGAVAIPVHAKAPTCQVEPAELVVVIIECGAAVLVGVDQCGVGRGIPHRCAEVQVVKLVVVGTIAQMDEAAVAGVLRLQRHVAEGDVVGAMEQEEVVIASACTQGEGDIFLVARCGLEGDGVVLVIARYFAQINLLLIDACGHIEDYRAAYPRGIEGRGRIAKGVEICTIAAYREGPRQSRTHRDGRGVIAGHGIRDAVGVAGPGADGIFLPLCKGLCAQVDDGLEVIAAPCSIEGAGVVDGCL